jgi:hypothetical protein
MLEQLKAKRGSRLWLPLFAYTEGIILQISETACSQCGRQIGMSGSMLPAQAVCPVLFWGLENELFLPVPADNADFPAQSEILAHRGKTLTAF